MKDISIRIYRSAKKLRFALLLICVFLMTKPAQAQHYIGARVGWGLGYGRLEPISSYIMKPVFGTWSGGFQWKYYGPVRYIGAVGAELEFIQRAYQNNVSLDSDDYYRRVVNSINIPFIWHIHMNTANNKFRVFLNAGLWASYNFSSYYQQKSGNNITEGVYKMKLVKDNPLGYGLLGGLGFNLMFGKWEFMMEARYYFSYGDILRNSAVYANNPTRSPLDNVNVSLGFFYRIGSKPHEPLPPPWYLKSIARKRAAQEEKLKTEIKNDGTDQTDGVDKTEQSSETDTEGHK